eukprot:TRINITY_DN1910_c0_g1_i5.p1 TRINITY_DN1910_c0_g1~~TRINITY_DN1910_c0_g1_i5.p1  ORF type:complete len:593 (+),score=159.92 TRINITY_DN1910_c0_g1_i5:117-1895(+)
MISCVSNTNPSPIVSTSFSQTRNLIPFSSHNNFSLFRRIAPPNSLSSSSPSSQANSGSLSLREQFSSFTPRELPQATFSYEYASKKEKQLAQKAIERWNKEMKASTAPPNTFEKTIDALYACPRNCNATEYHEWRDLRAASLGVKSLTPFQEHQPYLSAMGISDIDMENLKVIHVTGTKGKGSTCAMAESILRECGVKTGMFTSPHFVSNQERIRINGIPISEEKFSLYFWEALGKIRSSKLPPPPYFNILTLMSILAFVKEKVEVGIYEVGIGGDLDPTNVWERPSATAVTNIGFDHMDLLGNTLESIAKHKSGIYKTGSLAISTPQSSPSIEQVLKSTADRVGAPFVIAPPLPDLVSLGLNGDYQRKNAAVAISCCKEWLRKNRAEKWKSMEEEAKSNASQLPKEFLAGLAQCKWPGRSQIIGVGDDLMLYFDSAHTGESLLECLSWFSQACPALNLGHTDRSKNETDPILVFTCKASKEWMPDRLVKSISDMMEKKNENEGSSHKVRFSKIIICPPWFDPENLSKDEISAGLGTLSFQESLKQTFVSVLGDNCPPIDVAKGVKECFEMVCLVSFLFFFFFFSFFLFLFF